MSNKLLPPFPYFGGKRRVTELVWRHLGDVEHYIEPFLGGAAMLLGRPHTPRIETVNDLDCNLVNFWRALQSEPRAVHRASLKPIFEADYHATHAALVRSGDDFREHMLTDPVFYDVQRAGQWVWGLRLTIGAGWCDGKPSRSLPRIGPSGGSKRPLQLEHLMALAERLRSVRVCCGDWMRICKNSVAGFNKYESVGVFLDPPYRPKGRSKVYTHEQTDHDRIQAWAIEAGRRENTRVALCGYEGDYEMPDSWTKIHWQSQGGYGNQGVGPGRVNRNRERIWLSSFQFEARKHLSFEEVK